MPKERIRWEVEVQHPTNPNRWFDLDETDEADAEYYGKVEYLREFPKARKEDLTVYVKRK